MFERLKEDIAAVKERDPAATSTLQILLLYPGLRAVRMHRRANWLWHHNHKFLARYVSQRAVRKTGIEIHPAAKIAAGVFIDHGQGVVIGETAEVGAGTVIYQGVTGKECGKRHPTVGKDCVLSAGAKILGAINIGDGAKVGAGAVVLKDVPAKATVVGVPARIVKIDGQRTVEVDPYLQEICSLRERSFELEKKIAEFEDKLKEIQNENL